MLSDKKDDTAFVNRAGHISVHMHITCLAVTSLHDLPALVLYDTLYKSAVYTALAARHYQT
jgi:hypothetical protein